jgi:anti-sigma regulatory factor (Ser/Thr protein kinase)
VQSAVALRAESQSAGAARAWIRERLTAMGRPDLVDSAQLATSELVTNAILHARTPLTVAVSNDTGEILIEVADASTGRLSQVDTSASSDGELTTVGNGLHIIGALARRWGVRERGADGKTVWFVPASSGAEARAVPRFPPDILQGVLLDDADAVTVVLHGVPVRLLWECRFRVRDLRREMALLTMQRHVPVGVPHRLVELAQAVDRLNTAVLRHDDDFARAVTDREASVEMHYAVPRGVGAACAGLADMLDEVDDYCRTAQLLTLAAPPEESRLRHWFLYEFARQTSGEAPRAYAAQP